jgi:hypothetical protein
MRDRLVFARRASDVVGGGQLSGTFLAQPSLSYAIGKKLDFENPDVDGVPTRSVESVSEVSATAHAAVMKDCSAPSCLISRGVPPSDHKCVAGAVVLSMPTPQESFHPRYWAANLK